MNAAARIEDYWPLCSALCARYAGICAGLFMPEGDQEHWLSYRELGTLLGCTANAARMHAVRRGWPRRAPNRIGDCARVLVPVDIVVRPCMTHDAEQFVTQPNGYEQANVRAAFDAHDMLKTIRETVEALVTPLREQIEAERARADRERDRADQAEQRFAVLLAQQRTTPARRRRWWRWRRG
jgi:hypothetical protein